MERMRTRDIQAEDRSIMASVGPNSFTIVAVKQRHRTLFVLQVTGSVWCQALLVNTAWMVDREKESQ